MAHKFEKKKIIDSLRQKIKAAQADEARLQEKEKTTFEKEKGAKIASLIEEIARARRLRYNRETARTVQQALVGYRSPGTSRIEQLEKAIKVIEMMEGDVITIKGDDNLLNLAL